MKGHVHIYCEDGKERTTATMGLVVRTAGRGKRVVVIRFLRAEDSDEVEVLCSIPDIVVLPCEKAFGFYFQMTEEQKRETTLYYESLLKRTWSTAVEIRTDMMILNEIVTSCSCHLVEEKRLSDLLDSRPEQLELIMTGRNPSEALQACANYISEIKKVKHPFDSGVMARKGTEY